ncbi:hypothetical protein SNE40_001202 [Patella caerulea]|uniref:Aminotransferase class V domain-containing protein n=1 Tax=Patella caerulea TaxID=87958 RepID=A0AAN8KI63_PATCE
MDLTGLENVEFGSSIREKEFFLREKSVHLNNGSYGTVPRRVFDRRIKYCLELESHPDNWFRNNLRKYWLESKEAICKFVNVKDTDCLVFVPNATTGINSILKSLSYENEIILGTNETYQAVQNTIKFIGDTVPGAVAQFIDIQLPITSKQQIVDLYEDFLQKNKNVKIAVIDAITSPSSILLPIKEILDVCRKHGVLSLIDGAHAPGQIPLDLDELGADFFVGNLHKWLFAPRGCAILYAAKEHIHRLHSLSTSWNLNKGFDLEFRDNGTRDHSPFTCAASAVQFYQQIGGMSKISTYNRELVREGREYLLKLWGAEKQAIPEDMESPFLLNIKLPPLKDYIVSDKSALQLALDILATHDVMTYFVSYQGNTYCRLSCQVYNTIDDYIKLGDVVKDLFKKNH